MSSSAPGYTSSVPQNDDASTNYQANIADLVWRLAKNCVLLVARFYVMIILVAYEWVKKIATGALTPFEPIFAQVRKVPKKDASVEGIFYQVLRLQFLVVLYMTPLVGSWVEYFTQPLMRMKDWAEDFVDMKEKTRRMNAKE